MIASVCIYTMPAIVNGERCRVAQVSGVGTLPEYRLRGLNRRLHQIALGEALPSHRFAFLFADDEAIPFYRKCGFRPVAAHAVVVALPRQSGNARSAENVDLGVPAIRESLYRLAAERAPVSDAFSTHNPKLVMYHLFYRLRDHIWFLRELDTVVLMKRNADTVVVYDILAREMPSFEALVPYLADAGAVRRVEFRFPTDRLHAPAGELRELDGCNVHVLGDFPLGDHPIFPFTSQA